MEKNTEYIKIFIDSLINKDKPYETDNSNHPSPSGRMTSDMEQNNSYKNEDIYNRFL